MVAQVHLEGRSRLLVFETDGDETLVLAPSGRRPLAQQDVNNPCTGPLTIGGVTMGENCICAKPGWTRVQSCPVLSRTFNLF
jgi:hypothetical protein